jgi:hypothetical protein
MTCFRKRFLLTALGLIALGGCSSTQIVDDLPGVIGLPQDAPARPATPYQFPAVHDMPPPRTTEPMSAEDQLRMEKELSAARDRQENGKAAAEKASQPAKKTSKKDTKQKPADEQTGGTAGAKPNP